jgi:toxin YoeB
LIFEIIWTPTAANELKYWLKHNQKKSSKIKLICQSIQSSPKEGLGKPERLKHLNENVWSRRIDQEHRLVYQIKDNSIYN